MARVFSEIVSEAGTLIGRTDPVVQKVLKESINRRYREILNADSWPELHREVNVTVEAGESAVGLPFEAEIVRSIYNTGINQMLERLDPVEMDQRFGNIVDQAGALRHFSILGVRGGFKNFSDGFFANASSTNSADSCVVRVTGFTGVGDPYEVGATVNGTNTILLFPNIPNIGGAEILTLTKDRDTNGSVLLAQQFSSDASVGSIAPGERAARYTWVRFARAADIAVSLRVQTVIFPPALTDDNDVPIIRGIENILVVGAQADAYRFLREHQKATGEELRYRDLRDEFVHRRQAEGDRAIQSQGTMHRYRDREGW